MKRAVLPLLAVIALAAAGCGATDTECSTGQVYAEGSRAGQCASSGAVQDSEHAEQVQKEEGEVEAVLKHRQAEETANQLESATD